MKRKNLLIISIVVAFISIQCSNSGKITTVKNGILLENSSLNLKVQFYAPNAVRVVKYLPGTQPDSSSLIVVQKELPNIKVDVKETDKTVCLSSEKLKVIISKKDGRIEYENADSSSILKEKGMAEIAPTAVKNEKAYSIKQGFELTADEGIYGLGQHQNGFMNYRGHKIALAQANTEAVTPFFISTKGYGILWDNYSKTIFEDNQDGASMWSDVASAMDYYFIAGSNMDTVIAGYRNLTGQAPMYGKWAYGYWQSKEHYETAMSC